MGDLIGLMIVILIVGYFYKAGKSEGSRKGYHVGRSRRHH